MKNGICIFSYLMIKFQSTENAAYLKIFSLCNIHISHDSRIEKVATMVFEESMVTQGKWLEFFSWQMILRLGLSEPPCVFYSKTFILFSKAGSILVYHRGLRE